MKVEYQANKIYKTQADLFEEDDLIDEVDEELK